VEAAWKSRWYSVSASVVAVIALLAACQGQPGDSMTPGIPSTPTAPSRSPAPVRPSSPLPPTFPPRLAVAATSRVLFTGNVFWGRYVDDWSQASDLGTAYPFSRLDEFDRDGYDAWISGLECPTVAGLDLSSAEQERALAFNCPPEYLEEAARWFTAFSLANNHTDNQGEDGFEETKRHLTQAGIQYFGHYDPDELDEVCGAVLLPVTVAYDRGSSARGELPVALCGYHGVFKIPSSQSLDLIDQYSKHLPVIALPHMGAEYKAEPDQIKTDTYRAMIDRGADMVLGDHPHWVQSAEEYDGKLILYSMGNFIFDQQSNTEVTRSAAVEVVINAAASPDLEGWLDLAPVCAGDLEACVAGAEERGLERLEFEYHIAIVASANAERLTHPASAAEQAEVEARLGWKELAERFG
jgi:poly-gamma-glutamate synthesis protein (capsule biosynthesis protein)